MQKVRATIAALAVTELALPIGAAAVHPSCHRVTALAENDRGPERGPD